jgi:GTP pyrophosphokinase
MPLRTELQNGDQVEIVTSRAQTPSPTWERFVVTGKARACIRRYIRTQQRAQYVELGRAMMQKEFQHEGYEYADKSVEGVLKKFKAEEAEDVLAQIGEGMLGAREVLNAIFPGTRKQGASEKVVPIGRQRAKSAKGNNAIPIRGLIPGMAMHFAGCCHPLPGDRIVGIVTTGKGVTIHTIDCETLESFAETPERWLDVAWDQDSDGSEQHVGRLAVVITNQPGSLGSLTTVIGKNQGNISNLKITNRSIDFFEVLVDVEVKDVRHLTNIIAALRATPSISSVDRARG